MLIIHLWAVAYTEASASRLAHLLRREAVSPSRTPTRPAPRMSGVLILLILIFHIASLHHREPAPRRSPISALTSPLLTTA